MSCVLLSKKKNLGDVSRCDCGIVHVNLNGLTLRLRDADFVSLAAMMQESSAKVINLSLAYLMQNNQDKGDE